MPSIPSFFFCLFLISVAAFTSYTKPAYTVINLSPLFLNRILFDVNECIISSETGQMHVTLTANDYRSKHVREILRLSNGDSIKLGIINVGLIDTGTYSEDPISGMSIFNLGFNSSVVQSSRPEVDLILAVPRPLRLERLLPVIACQGVGRIILIGADKVEKDYFGSHLFRRPECLKACLVEGLSQAGVDCNLPDIIVRKNLFKFLLNDLDELYPEPDCMRLLFHPLKNEENEMRLSSLINERGSHSVVAAIGPEGGWTDEEVALFRQRGFSQVDLGRRILRTDTAVKDVFLHRLRLSIDLFLYQVVAALSLTHEWAHRHLRGTI